MSDISNHEICSDIVVHQRANQSSNVNDDGSTNNEENYDFETHEFSDQCCSDENDDANSLASDATSLDISNDDKISARRHIVNLELVFRELHRLFDDHADVNDCQFRDWKLVKIHNIGLKSQCFFRCQNCSREGNFFAQGDLPGVLDIHKATTLSTITGGSAFATINEIFAAMNIKFMSPNTYIKYRGEMTSIIKLVAHKTMTEGATEEKRRAIAEGRVVRGMGCIRVIVDGQWGTRSYNDSGFDASSGSAVIIGAESGKVLFVAVRNKLCSVCDYYKEKNLPCRPHVCYKNFNPDLSSTSMEADIIAEGFNCSIEMHGLIYSEVVGDNDASVYATILHHDPYRDYNIEVMKIDCTNHLLRNMCKHLRDISKTPDARFLRIREFVELRKAIGKKSKEIRDEVDKATVRRQNEEGNLTQKAGNLSQDLRVIPYHVFGQHNECQSRNIDCNINAEERNDVPQLEHYGLMDRIQDVMNFLSRSAESLVQRKTNNPAELFNSIICKTINGKRILFGRKGSYDARVYAAVVQFNTQEVLTELNKFLDCTEYDVAKDMEKQRQAVVERNRVYRQENGRGSVHSRCGTDEHYGPNSRQPTLSLEVLEREKAKELTRLRQEADKWEQNEFETREQSNSEKWRSLRKRMLTASNFGPICRRKEDTRTAKMVCKILYPSARKTVEMQYGIDMESVARAELSDVLQKVIQKCGLFIDQQYPFLGASPDGLIENDTIVEIKCPYKAKGLTVEQALQNDKELRRIYDAKDSSKMNKTHHYYYQVQGQLHITKKEYCEFVLWSDKSMKRVTVERDDQFWNDNMEQKLTRFYMDAMLREIVERRKLQRQPIIEPEWVKPKEKRPSENANADRRKIRRKEAETDKNQEEEPIENEILTNVDQTTADYGEPSVNNAVETNFEYAPCEINDIYGYQNERAVWCNESIEERTLYMNNQVASIENCRRIVRNPEELITDAILDTFLKIVREKTEFITQSVQFVIFRDIAQPVRTKSIVILGANSTHWRCMYFDGANAYIYDSMRKVHLNKQELEYISNRFPNLDKSSIKIMKVQQQIDLINCGVFVAAFATSIALGEDPTKEEYPDVIVMREHFLEILETQELKSFKIVQETAEYEF